MKKNELQQYITKGISEVEKELNEVRSKMSSLQFDLKAGKSNTVKEIRASKKKIAQLLTLLRERSRKENTK